MGQASRLSFWTGKMPVPPVKVRALGNVPNVGAPLAAPSSGRASLPLHTLGSSLSDSLAFGRLVARLSRSVTLVSQTA